MIFAISDIHGRYDLLKEIVEDNIDFTDKDTMLVCCGDYVDGSDYRCNNYLILNYLYELHQSHPNQVIVLMGNHDKWLSNVLSSTS